MSAHIWGKNQELRGKQKTKRKKRKEQNRSFKPLCTDYKIRD